MKTQKNRNKGFTLVELIIVVAIIAVLSVVAVVAYGNISGQAKEAALASDANVVIRALNTYNALSGSPITGLTAGSDLDTMRGLKLVKGTHGVDMQLGVTLTQDRLDEVIGVIEYNAASKMWILS